MIDRTARPLILVNSGAYVEQELIAEFGALPPAFLPVGLGRLYELQARAFDGIDGDLHLTLPESFQLADWDAERLAALGVQVLRTPDALSLGAALLFALGKLGFEDRPLRLLHGDTLVSGLDLATDDAVAVADGADGYRWGHVAVSPDRTILKVARPDQAMQASPAPRLCGYFAFASVPRFAESLALANGDFYNALNHHAGEQPLRAVEPRQWLDFGHVQTYFRSRRVVTTERAFNSLTIGERHVRKRSTTAAQKLAAEARWLTEVPASIAPFCARVLDQGQDGDGYFYDSEYEYMPTLAELYVLGRITPSSWLRILTSCGDFISASVDAVDQTRMDGFLKRFVVGKTASRLESYTRAAGLDPDAPLVLNGRPTPSLHACLAEIEAVLADCGDAPSVMHGDFCFSNILYSFRTDRVRLIDPRGLDERGAFSLHGDCRYDLAKLMHSLSGRYDLIMAGQYAGGRTGERSFELSFPSEAWRDAVEETAKVSTMGGIALGSKVVWATMTSLFLSMAPLHADRPDRQATFIANALRLFLDLERAT